MCLPVEPPSRSPMEGPGRKVAVPAVTLPFPHPVHTMDHLGAGIYGLARGRLILVHGKATMLSRFWVSQKRGYGENCDKEVRARVMMGTGLILHEAAESHSCHCPRFRILIVFLRDHFLGLEKDTGIMLDLLRD